MLLGSQTGDAEIGDHRFIKPRCHGQVIYPRRFDAGFEFVQKLRQRDEIVRLLDVARHVENRLRQRLPDRLVQRTAEKLGGRRGKLLTPLLVREGSGERPTMRVAFGRRPLRYSSYSAGTSLRLVKSPEAPKMTIV